MQAQTSVPPGIAEAHHQPTSSRQAPILPQAVQSRQEYILKLNVYMSHMFDVTGLRSLKQTLVNCRNFGAGRRQAAVETEGAPDALARLVTVANLETDEDILTALP